MRSEQQFGVFESSDGRAFYVWDRWNHKRVSGDFTSEADAWGVANRKNARSDG